MNKCCQAEDSGCFFLQVSESLTLLSQQCICTLFSDVTTSSGAEEQPTSDANMKEGEQADGSKTSNDHDQGSCCDYL